MKNKFFKGVLTVMILVSAVAFTAKVEKKVIKTETSKIIWKGYKVTRAHEGTINLKEGFLLFSKEKLTGGAFVVDMTTLTSTDLSGGYKDKLNNHLKSDDFFGVDNYPTSTLVITRAKSKGKNAYYVTGKLTIKGKTNPIAFDMSIYGSKASATLKVDRSKYDVKYGSGSFFDNLGDKAIYDEFELVVDLQF